MHAPVAKAEAAVDALTLAERNLRIGPDGWRAEARTGRPERYPYVHTYALLVDSLVSPNPCPRPETWDAPTSTNSP